MPVVERFTHTQSLVELSCNKLRKHTLLGVFTTKLGGRSQTTYDDKR